VREICKGSTHYIFKEVFVLCALARHCIGGNEKCAKAPASRLAIQITLLIHSKRAKNIGPQGMNLHFG